MTDKQIIDAFGRRGYSPTRVAAFLAALTEEQQQLLIDADDDRQAWQEAMDKIADELNSKG